MVGAVSVSAGLLSSSDARFKKNISGLPDALNSILPLKGVSCDWRIDEFPDRNFARGKQLGFIAQDIEKVLPELVATGADGYKSINYCPDHFSADNASCDLSPAVPNTASAVIILIEADGAAKLQIKGDDTGEPLNVGVPVGKKLRLDVVAPAGSDQVKARVKVMGYYP